MSRTLNVVDHLLTRGRRYHSLGRDLDALHILQRLSSFRDLPAEAAEEAQVRLAEIELRRRKYSKARRHLAAALVHQPDSARYHQLMATAHDADDRGDPEQALEHYRRAVELAPDRADWLSEFGLLAVLLGEAEEGLRALRRAAELAPDEPEVIRKLAEGLCEASLADEARQALRAALFRNPRDGRFRSLWNDLQFQLLHQAQQAAGIAGRFGGEEGPALLPFRWPAPQMVTMGEGDNTIRHDPAEPLPLPHRPRRARRPDQKNAQ